MTTIKFRRDTSANWTSVNPIPAQGEPCYETDTGKLKIGNGSDSYTTLPYVSDGGGSAGDLPIATATTLGGVKIGNNLSITADGTLSATGGSTGTTDYTQLENKPQINSVELTGNKTLDDLGIQAKGDYQPVGDYATTADIPTKTSELTNDSGFLTEAPIPTNMVTTDTNQTISGSKTFSAMSNFNNGCNFNSNSYSENYFKKGFKIGNIDIYNTTGSILRIGESTTNFLTFDNGNIKFMSTSSTPGMNITDGVITTAYNKPYLKIKEYNDNTNTHNLEINCDTTNNNNWSIACGDQTFINTANIDTTYMKWDSTSKKLTVNTAAIANTLKQQDKSFHVIKTYVKGTSGYRIWSDGYCEQWGVANYPQIPANTGKSTTITFLKKFANANYCVSHNIITDGGVTQSLRNNWTNLKVEVLQFGWYSTDSTSAGGTFCWKASGYLASGEY